MTSSYSDGCADGSPALASRGSMLYGVRDGALVHIDDVDRGLPCRCVCRDCQRPLVAKKGAVYAHHFQHVAADVQCNPSPESLVHAYAKQEIARMGTVKLPPFAIEATFVAPDGREFSAEQRFPDYTRDVKRSETEVDCHAGPYDHVTVRPDVLIHSHCIHYPLAVEVFFRHAVDEEKAEKLAKCAMSSVEVDLSDLPVTAPAAAISAAIMQPWRWRWVFNRDAIHHRYELNRLLTRSNSMYKPSAAEAAPRATRDFAIPTRKLAAADALMPRANRIRAELPTLTRPAMLDTVRALKMELQVALHCTYMGILPSQLPIHLMQKVDGQSSLGIHPVLWQTGIYARFCLTGGEFDVQAVEWWVREVFDHEAFASALYRTWTLNHFSGITEPIYHFLRNLSAQGLLREVKGARPWESRFAPAWPGKIEVVQLLLRHPPATSLVGSPTGRPSSTA